jgi:Zn-dependent protease with chaperone function
MSNVAKRFKTRKEVIYGTLMLVFGALLWLLLVAGILAAFNSGAAEVIRLLSFYLIYAVLFALFIWISSAAYRATAFGNMILLGPDQFPDLHDMVQAGAQDLGLKPAPKAFLYNSNGMFNAFARRLLGGRYLFLTSALVEADDDEQVRFVIGHELGHHAAGHLNPWLHFIRLPAYLVPFLQPAYSRAREYTCDSIGAHVSTDIVASRSSLQMLGCGCGRLNGVMSCEAFMAQEAMVPPIFGFLTEIFRSHPRLTRRVAALRTDRT